MPIVEAELPDRIDSELERLIHHDDFVNRDQAHEEILALGLMAYHSAEDDAPPVIEDIFTQTMNDQTDPAEKL